MAGKVKINLEHYQVGRILGAKSARLSAEKTNPPPYYTEASLLDDMVGAYKFASTEEERAMLKETNGIGTARTREPVITDLMKKKQIERVRGKGKGMILKDTPLGRTLTKAAPPVMTSVVMTAKWEMFLAMVAKGKITPEQFRAKMDPFVAGLVERAKTQKVG